LVFTLKQHLFSVRSLYPHRTILVGMKRQQVKPQDFSVIRDQVMSSRRYGRSGLMLPEIALGLWHNFSGVDTFENGRAMVRCAFDLGLTHFDLANNYGLPTGVI
jgi:hypothetical protein